MNLGPEELKWTAKYPHGVFCFLQREEYVKYKNSSGRAGELDGYYQTKEYFGLSFQLDEDNPVESNFVWEVPRKDHPSPGEVTARKKHPVQILTPIDQLDYFQGKHLVELYRKKTKNKQLGKGDITNDMREIKWLKGMTPSKARDKAKKITCLYPTIAGTFQPITASLAQINIMRQFLAIADTVDELLDAEATELEDGNCDRLRGILNQQYDDFFAKHGLLSNFKSYFEGVWCSDIRLAVRILSLENEDLVSGKADPTKADIFFSRQSFPGHKEFNGTFDDENIDTRLSKAYAQCLRFHGKLNLEAIAKWTCLSIEGVETGLRNLDLIYRLPKQS